MRAEEVRRAVAAATSTATELGLVVDEAVVLNDSNRLVVRLAPCDVVARVTPLTHHAGHHASAEREVELVRELTAAGSPVAELDPRVPPHAISRDGFVVTLWAPVAPVDRVLPPASYALALADLHAGLRRVDVPVPHVLDRIAAVQRDAADRDLTPDLAEADRALLADALHDLSRSIAERRAPEQILHGEPHPWNVLLAVGGPLFIDFENTARGPVEYDLAWAPRAVADLAPDADPDLVDECRGLVLAMIVAYRYRRDDQHPAGPPSRAPFLVPLRAGPPYPTCDEITW